MELFPHQVLAWNSKKRIISLVGGTGAGKCVKSTEPIPLADGTVVSAGSLIGKSFAVLSPTLKGIIPVEARAELNSLGEPVYRMRTDSGREITRNAEHPIFMGTKEPHGSSVDVRGWTPISEVRPGQFVAAVKSFPACATGYLPDGDIAFLAHHRVVPNDICGMRDERVALFLSHVYALDGWARGAEIGLSSSEPKLIRGVQRLLLRFGISSRIDIKGNSETLFLCSGDDVCAFADQVGIFGKMDEVLAVKQAASLRITGQAWRSSGLSPELRWERVVEVEREVPASTVAINVPATGIFLTDFLEHNTYFGPRWVFRKLTEKPDTRVLCIGTGYERHVSRVMMREITTMLKGLNQKYHLNERKGELTLEMNGSQCLFGSSENALSLEGPHLEACWIDEAGLMSRLAWDVAQRRTGYTNGQILITTIPYFEGWLKCDVYSQWLAGNSDIDWIPCKTKDNPKYSADEIERMRRQLRPEKFEIYYEGNWARPAGLIFPDPSDDEITFDYETDFAWNDGSNCDICHGDICKGMIPCEWPAFSAHDYGYNAPTTGVWGRLSPDDVLYIVRDYEANEMTIENHIEVWRAQGLTDIDEGWGDPANPEVWQRAMDLDYPIIKGNNNISAGLDAVYDRFLSGRLKIARGCKTLLDHRSTYRWATAAHDENILLDRPLKPQPAEHCFVAGTQVATRDGSVSIEDVKPGTLVWTRDGLRPVVAAGLTRLDTEVCDITLSDGRVLTSTPDHLFWTDRGWMKAAELPEGQPLWDIGSGFAQPHVVAVSPAGRANVYDLTVAGTPEFFANGVLVHNCFDALRYLVMGIADRGLGVVTPTVMSRRRSVA